MKAAILRSANQLEITTSPDPQIGPDEALIKVMACGLCPTDVRKFFGRSSCKLPIILGHEIGGYLIKVGENVEKLKVNDRVTVVPDIPCGSCFYCVQNKFNYCQNLRSVGYGTDKIQPLDGGYAQFVKVPAASILPIPDEMSYEEATYVEPLSCAVRTLERARVDVDDSVAVIGDGRMGLLHLQLLKMLGLKKLFVIGLMDDRLQLAQKLGAEVLNAMKGSVAETIIKRSEHGLSAVIDTTGEPAAINGGLAMLGPGGRMVLFASSPSGSRIELDPNLIHYKEVIITGSYGNGSRMDFVKAIDFISSKRVAVQPLTSHRLPLEKLAEGFRLIEQRKGLRVIVIPNNN
jgi:L-iditol 2-dehydrogenase